MIFNMAAVRHIGFVDVIICHPDTRYYIPNIVLNFHLDWFSTFWHTWSFMFHHFGWKLPIQGQIFRVFPQLLGNGWGLGVGWKWAPIGGLQYQTHMQAPKYDVQFLRSEALRSSSSSSSTRQIKECKIVNWSTSTLYYTNYSRLVGLLDYWYISISIK